MPTLKGKELRIVGFLCNWCSYGGADTAGVARAGQPTDLRIIRVPCSGRIDPLFVLRALFNGADGVLVSGCHPRDCHYSAGNYYARRRLEVLKLFLPVLGIDTNRFEYTWVSASEGQRWKEVVTSFTERIHKLGPAPRFEDAQPMLDLASYALAPIRNLGTGQANPLADLKTAIKGKLAELDCVIGWKEGFDKAHAVPHFMSSDEDVDKLTWGPLNVHNLATYLPSYKGKKVGIVVKGCDSLSVVELLQENLIKREDVVIFSMPCESTLNMDLVHEKLGDYSSIDSVTYSNDTVNIVADGQEYNFAMKEYSQGKCKTCLIPAAMVADVRIGTPPKPPELPKQMPLPPELAHIESMSLQERMNFWSGHMERCVRCYACRNACPMCVCRDHCVAEARDPHWLTQDDSVSEKLFFQTIHALHLAGRCTGCGECQRACPVSIPILSLRQQLRRIVAMLFDDYKAGIKVDAVPPLLGYEVQEKNIHERDWK